MNMYTYLFKVTYWNEVEEKLTTETAVITGLNTYTDAVSELEDHYGKDLERFEAYAFDSAVAIFPEEKFEQLKEDLENG